MFCSVKEPTKNKNSAVTARFVIDFRLKIANQYSFREIVRNLYQALPADLALLDSNG